jgi:hypothetical protein
MSAIAAQEDPGLSLALVEQLEKASAIERPSGVYVCNVGKHLGEPPFALTSLRKALTVRFGLSGTALDEAERLVRAVIQDDLRQHRERSGWLNDWRTPDVRLEV